MDITDIQNWKVPDIITAIQSRIAQIPQINEYNLDVHQEPSGYWVAELKIPGVETFSVRDVAQSQVLLHVFGYLMFPPSHFSSDASSGPAPQDLAFQVSLGEDPPDLDPREAHRLVEEFSKR